MNYLGSIFTFLAFNLVTIQVYEELNYYVNIDLFRQQLSFLQFNFSQFNLAEFSPW